MPDVEELEPNEFRQDLLDDMRVEHQRNRNLAEDHEYFLKETGIDDIQEQLQHIRKMCEEFNYDFTEIIEEAAA